MHQLIETKPVASMQRALTFKAHRQVEIDAIKSGSNGDE
jgi:hypothetical protein